MPARAYWKGYLRLSLVTIGVEVYAATSSSAEISLHQIHEPTGKRVRYQKIVPGIGEIESGDIVKGYEIEGGAHVVLTGPELDAIKLETKRTIDLVQFVDYDDIDPRYFERPFYVVPADELSEEGFVVIREALQRARKIGLGQMTIRGRENFIALRPCGKGLLIETLRYADEVKKADKFFDDIEDTKPAEDLVELAAELIGRKAGRFDPASFKNHYDMALRALIEEKRKGNAIIEGSDDADVPPRGNVVNLMEALKRSVARKGEENSAAASAIPAPRNAKKAPEAATPPASKAAAARVKTPRKRAS